MSFQHRRGGLVLLSVFCLAEIGISIWKNATHSNSNSSLVLKETTRPRLDNLTIAFMNITMTIPDSVEAFYSGIRMDRSGSMILDMLMAHAFAWTLGRKYGGVCGRLTSNSGDHRYMVGVLGLQDELPYPHQPPPCEQLNDTSMLLPPEVYRDWKDTGAFVPEWISYIRSRQILPERNSTSNTTLAPSRVEKQSKIIVHVRRGDVNPCMRQSFRYVPNSLYLDLISQYAGSNVTIFSEARSTESWKDFSDSCRVANVSCMLSLGRDMANVWREMIGFNDDDPVHTRRTLIISKSSFSIVPAILSNPSTTTVVYIPFWHRPLPHWEVVGWDAIRMADNTTQMLRQKHCSLKT